MLLKSIALGIVAAPVALAIATLSSGSGVRLNTEAWPPTARAILAEQPGEPISLNQWRRIEEALEGAGNNALPSHLVAAELRRAWPVVVLVAVLALLGARWLLKARAFNTAVGVLAPSALLLLAAFVHTHPYYP